MNSLDTLYRAFTDMRKSTEQDRDCALQRTAITRADAESDVVESVRHTLIIEEDWVQAIQDGLVFVEKAIAEERQFIRNNGEVVPIEKVRRVSRDSVEHLARHSDLITTEPEEGKDMIPDELYTVERLSDYAVYENRFLYMLLVYLQQFIAIRYDAIVDLANTYRGSLAMDKTIKSGKQNLTFKIELKEERRNDPLLSEINPNKGIIERIGMLGKMVAHYLNTPLMQEVKKAPMLHPPITVTNVLRMNHNFRGAMKLYEFVSSYDKLGYSSEREDKRISPLPDLAGDDFAEVEALASYLTYQYGMGVKDILKERYRREEEERKHKADEKLKEQLKALRKRIAETGQGAEEYMLTLEKRNRTLESVAVELDDAKKEIMRLTDENAVLNDTVAGLNARDAAHMEEIKRLQAEADRTVAVMTEERERALQALRAENEVEKENLRLTYAGEVEREKENCRCAVEQFKEEHLQEMQRRSDRIAELEAGYAKVEQDAQDRIRTAVAAAEEQARTAMENGNRIAEESKQSEARMREKYDEMSAENKRLSELKTLADARVNALRFKCGMIKEEDLDDYTTEPAFDEIENQYKAFTDFFKKSWKRTKKKIRAAVKEQLDNDPDLKADKKKKQNDADRPQTQPDKPQTEQTQENE